MTDVQDAPITKPFAHLGPKIDSDVLPLLSSCKPLVDHLTGLIMQEQRLSNIPPYQLEVKLHLDAETGRKNIHIKQTVDTDAQTAMDYWDRVGILVEQWAATLPTAIADIVHDDIFMTIHWKTDVSTR